LQDLRSLRSRVDELPKVLSRVISADEMAALTHRIVKFADDGCYPVLSPRRNIPYGWW
jgi:hypothetical protein